MCADTKRATKRYLLVLKEVFYKYNNF